MKLTTVNIKDLSKYIIHYFNSEGIIITPLKLQKILYYAQAWHLVFFNKHPLFNEAPEAWVNGPVYRTVYNMFKKEWLRNETIYVDDTEKILLENLEKFYEKLNLTDDQAEYLNTVLKEYGSLTSGYLVYLTHAEKPWNEARYGLKPFEKSTNTINYDSMHNYYSNRLKSRHEKV